MRWAMTMAAAVSLLGCGRCGAEGAGADVAVGDPATARGSSASSRAEIAPDEGRAAGDKGDGGAAGAVEVVPGPDDCWAPGDVVELQLEARGFPLRGLKFAGPDCDDELEAAVARGDLPAVRSMIEQVRIPEHWPARSPRCRTAELGTLLHLSAASGATQVTEYLISEGANVRGCDHQGTTPLHVAAANLDLPMAKLLVDKGALVDAVDIEGNRPLHRCFDNPAFRPRRPDLDPEQLEAAQLIAGFLVSAGADVGAHRRSGEIAADLAPFATQNWIPAR